MNRLELRQRVEDYLQDRDNRRWQDTEINRYISDAQREFIRLVEFPHVTAEVDFSNGIPKAGTLSSNGKTAKVVTSTAHGLNNGDAVYIDRCDQAVFSGGKVIRKVNDTTFTYPIGNATSVDDSTVVFYSIGPNITKPSSIEKIVSAEIQGVQLMILNEGELNSAVWRTTTSGQFIEGVFGTVPNPFTTIQTTLTGTGAYTESWGEREGHIEAIVFNNMTQDDFRIWPLPANDENFFIDKKATLRVADLSPTVAKGNLSGPWEPEKTYPDTSQTPEVKSISVANGRTITTSGNGLEIEFSATTDVNGNPTFAITDEGAGFNFGDTIVVTDPGSTGNTATFTVTDAKLVKKIKLRGTPLLADLDSDSASPTISTRYHECLVWGALERAFLKESQSKDVSKSEMYKSRFMQTVAEAKSLEGMVSSSNSEGRNESRFRVARVF